MAWKIVSTESSVHVLGTSLNLPRLKLYLYGKRHYSVKAVHTQVSEKKDVVFLNQHTYQL
jgi:hypothetical protein